MRNSRSRSFAVAGQPFVLAFESCDNGSRTTWIQDDSALASLSSTQQPSSSAVRAPSSACSCSSRESQRESSKDLRIDKMLATITSPFVSSA
jgi:hypothetical protein